MPKVVLNDIIESFSLEVLSLDGDLNCPVKVSDISRPGLALAGYLQYFDEQRIQVIGNTETSYLKTLGRQMADERWLEFIKLKFPCLIITSNLELPIGLLRMAAGRHLPIFRTRLTTTRFMAQLTDYLEQKLAPVVTIHAVLVDVHGIGALITGESGIGKSEAA